MACLILDASALIALFNDKDLHHKWALDAFASTLDYELKMTALTYAEVLVHPQRAGKTKVFENSISKLGIKLTPILPEHAGDLAELRAKTGLKMPDAVVLQQALLSKKSDAITAIATTDQSLSAAARKHHLEVYAPR